MFIRTAQPAPAGTLLKLECDTDPSAGEVLRAVGRVVWLRQGPEDTGQGPTGMGVKFVKLEPEGEGILERLMERLGPELNAEGVKLRGLAAKRPSSIAPAPTASDSLGGGLPAEEADAEEDGPIDEPWQDANHGDDSYEVVSPSADPAEGRGVSPQRNDGDGDGDFELDPSHAQPAAAQPPGGPTVVMAEELQTEVAARTRSSVPPEEDTEVPAQRGLGNVWLAFAAVVLLGGAISLQLSREKHPAAQAARTRADGERAAATAPARQTPQQATEPGETAAATSPYLLEVETEPTGAEVQVGETRLTAPAQVALSNLVKPVKVRAELAGHDPTATTVEANMFEERDGQRYKKITLQLTKTP